MEQKNTSLRICMFGHKRIPSCEGGIEVVVEELATRMVQTGHRVTCFNRSGHHVCGEENDAADYRNLKEYKGVKIKKVFTIDRKGLAAVTSSFSAALCAAFGKYDIVHIHAEGPAFFCWIPKLFGKKVIVTVHGLDHRRAKWGGFASRFLTGGEKNAVKYADKIIVLSRSVQRYFQEQYNRDTDFIPNGVNQAIMQSAEQIRNHWELKKDSYILYLGRVVPEKGIHYLIKAFQGINTDKKLVIAGGSSDTDSYMEELKVLAQNDERILFTGFVQGRLKEELYSNAYIYCLPSDLEGMPLSLLEAMSYGNCCLVSDIPECTEVVEDKAAVFHKGDVSHLQENLRELLENERRVTEYKQSAAKFITEKYNWDNVCLETMELYKPSLSQSQRVRSGYGEEALRHN